MKSSQFQLSLLAVTAFHCLPVCRGNSSKSARQQQTESALQQLHQLGPLGMAPALPSHAAQANPCQSDLVLRAFSDVPAVLEGESGLAADSSVYIRSLKHT